MIIAVMSECILLKRRLEDNYVCVYADEYNWNKNTIMLLTFSEFGF